MRKREAGATTRPGLPAIASPGPPPELHADRVTAEIVALLAAFIGREWNHRLRPIFKSAGDGSPKAQMRLAEKLRRAGQFALLRGDMTPGKRGKYRLRMVHWCGWNPVTDSAFASREGAPAKPWIAIRDIVIEGTGHNRHDQSGDVILLVTHHALSRATQRLGLRTAYDLYRALRQLWDAFAEQISASSSAARRARRTPMWQAR